LSLRSLPRLGKIIAVTARYRLDLLIDWQRLPRPARWFLQLSPLRLLPAPASSRGVRIRESLQDLGPVYIKFGQMLSTRRDLLAPDIAEELAKLQDEVPPFDEAEAIAIIERSLGQPIDRLFARFSPRALASASIAQVHAARLLSGQDVVVKVVRPGIETVIAQDIALLLVLANWLQRYVADGRRLRPVEVVADYKHTILDELDMQREAANTSCLRRNFSGSDLLYIPEVHWDYTRRNVLVMERIEGIPVSDIEAIRAQGTDMKLLAERGVEIFFTQVFRDNFFHADMHPGNIFISRKNPQKPQYIGVDCAIMGSLSDFDRYYLARNLIAIFERDYRQVAQLHVECGWVPPQTRVQDFEAAMRSTCEPVFEKPLSEISFGQLLLYLFQTARRFDMEIQPSLVLLQKTMLAIEGLGRDLYPQLDLWQTAKPFLDNWMKQRYAPTGLVQQLREHAPQWLEQLPQLPELVWDNLHKGSETKSLIELQQAQLQQLNLERQARRHSARNLRLALMAAAAALVLAQPPLLQQLAQLPVPTLALLAIAALLALRG
jgi:ubiquinone biosynthesis protein